MALVSVHRLDQKTSGILLFARDRQISQQFKQRQVHKVYEAILSGVVTIDQGKITSLGSSATKKILYLQSITPF